MFGKGGGALGAWIKEFCQLVFIQTIQAFIYAIIITVIMELYGQAVEAAATSSDYDYASGLGLFSVIALASVFKVEEITRKIFGFGPTKADHGNAIKSVAKTAFALKLGARVLDNGKKVAGGAKNWLGANKDAKKASSRLQRRMDALNKDNSHDDVPTRENNTSVPVNTSTPESRNEETRKLLEKRRRIQSMSANMRAKAETLNLAPEHKAELLSKADKLDARAKGIDEALEARLLDGDSGGSAGSSVVSRASGASAVSSSSGSSNGGGKSSNYHQAMLNLQEQYEAELSAAKKKRKEGFRTMTKGVLETGGAIVGATAGGILGFADGEIDDGIQGMLSGAGLGDATAEFAANTAFGSKDLVEGAIKTTSGAVKDYSKNIAKQYEEEKKAVATRMKELNQDAKNEVKRINKGAEKARADLEKSVELSAGQTAKAIAKAVGKGSVKAYQSRHGGIKQLSTNLKNLESQMNTTVRDINLDKNVDTIE